MYSSNLFVGKHQEASVAEFFVRQHPMQLLTGHGQAGAVRRVNHHDDELQTATRIMLMFSSAFIHS